MEHTKNKGNWQGEKTLITVCSRNKRTSELVQEQHWHWYWSCNDNVTCHGCQLRTMGTLPLNVMSQLVPRKGEL